MPAANPSSNGRKISSVAATAHAVNLYLEEMSASHALCRDNEKITAIHTRGKMLQVYRQFEARRDIVETMERSGAALPAWDDWPFWRSQARTLEKLENEVIARIGKHERQREVFTRGVCWECRPVLIHAYKFEPDPFLKVELILPAVRIEGCPDELPLNIIASAIRCHDFLVPKFIATPLPPYVGHEAHFETLMEYLHRTMPKNKYVSGLLPAHAAGDG